MAPATNPLRLQVIDRVVTVLKAIAEGTSYWYTPCEVVKRFVHWTEAKGFPTYMVFTDSGGKLEAGTPNFFSEEFNVNVKGIVKDHVDTVTKVERCLRDIRKAINDDTRPSTGAGSLGALGALVFIEEGATTDNGYLSLEGFGFFEQRIRIVISGDFGNNL